VGLAAIVDVEDRNDRGIVKLEEDSPFADTQAVLAPAALQTLDVAQFSLAITLQRVMEPPLDVAIQTLEVPPAKWKEFNAPAHTARRRRASSGETVSPFSARATSSSAAVCASMGSSSSPS